LDFSYNKEDNNDIVTVKYNSSGKSNTTLNKKDDGFSEETHFSSKQQLFDITASLVDFFYTFLDKNLFLVRGILSFFVRLSANR